MNDSHEPSYYEIALTNRQVLFAFVILLVCLLAAFIAGVWVGRGDAVAPPPQQAAAETGDPAADERDLERLNFFGDDGATAVETEEVEPAAGSTLREDLESGRIARRQPAAEPPPSEARAEPPEQARPEVRSEVRSEPPVQPPAPQPAPPAAQAPVRAAPAADGPVVQVFSSRDRGQAEQVVGRLKASGRPAYLSPVEVGGQTMYRVRLGPYADREEAQKVADAVRREHKLDTWITQ